MLMRYIKGMKVFNDFIDECQGFCIIHIRGVDCHSKVKIDTYVDDYI